MGVYALLTLVQARLVVQHMTDAVASDAGDPVLNMTILTWTSSHVPLTDGWWNFPGFHPLSRTLTFSEHLTGLTVFAAPLLGLFGNPVLAYNVLFLLSFVATAVAAYALAFALTRRHDAAFLAGLVFGFAPYRVAHLSHLQMLSAYWLPLALLALHRYNSTQRIGWAVAAAGAWLMQCLTNSYALVHGSVLVALWLLWFVLVRRRWRDLAILASAFGAAALVTIPIVASYNSAHETLGLRRDVLETTSFGADVLSFLQATSFLSVWGWVQFFDRPEGELFPGVALPILLLIGSVYWWRRAAAPPDPPAWRRARRWLSGAAVVAAGAAASVWLIGPWAISFGPARLSSSAVHKPVALTLVLLLLAGATTSIWRSAARRSSVLAFYASAALVTWLLALGPGPTLAGTPILYRAPYEWLLSLPGVDQLRVPARFWLITLLCLSVVAALLFSRATAGLSGQRRRMVLAAAALGLAADGWTTVRIAEAPRPAAFAATVSGAHVIEMPLGDLVEDAAAQYRGAIGGWRTFNGYSGYLPLHYQALRYALETNPQDTLNLLRGYGPLLVSVDTARDAEGRWAAGVAAHPAAVSSGSDGRHAIFRLPAAPAPEVHAMGIELRTAAITATCGADAITRLADDDLTTMWECSHGGDPAIVVELDAETLVASLTEWAGSRPGDPTAQLQVDTSLDGQSWDSAWNAPTALAALAGSLSSPTTNPMTVSFGPRRARFVRLRRTAPASDYRWWIAEIEINGPSSR